MITLVLLLFQLYTFSETKYSFGNLPVVSDLEPEHCFAKSEFYVEADPVYGLPRCSPFDDAVEKGSCIGYHKPDLYPNIVYKPTCDKNGNFGSKQCKGERATGRCFCFDANGERIFGQQWWSQAGDMTCACSRQKSDMGDSVYFNSLHCNSVGNYEELQCDVISEQCWCADEKTGRLISTVVPEKAKSKLPCYNSAQVGISYLRQCESRKHAENKIIHQFKLRGTRYQFGEFLCDDDGSYGAYTFIDGSAYCTWRDNSKISSYQSGTNHTGLNCNCARDSKFFSLSGKSQHQKCLGNGNYEIFQKSTISAYCVDTDGYRKSPSGVTVKDESQCNDYEAYH